VVEVSVIGIDHFTTGQGGAKYGHEKAMLAGPIPVRVLRTAQFHQFVPQLIEWGTQGHVAFVRKTPIQSVASQWAVSPPSTANVNLAAGPSATGRPRRQSGRADGVDRTRDRSESRR
jgi:hypothetical protein